MPTIIQTLNIRHRRLIKQHRSQWVRLGIISVLIASMLLLAIASLSIVAYLILTQDLPPARTISALLEPPNGALLQPSRLYDRNETHVLMILQDPVAQNRQYLRVGNDGQTGLDQVSQNLIDATVTAFDPEFWTEPVFTLKGLTGGTDSTVAQMLVSDLLLDSKSTSIKKNLQERLLAMQITAQYGREKVLEWYLNSARYGEFVVGVDAASRVYLAKPATQLSIAESTLLTVISQTPEANPWNEWQQVRDRQVQLIQRMQSNGLITSAEEDSALRENIQLMPHQTIQSAAPEFTNWVLEQLSTQLPLERIYRGGYKIITTLDFTLQQQAACNVQHELARLGENQQHLDEINIDCGDPQLFDSHEFNLNQLPLGVDASVLVLDPQLGQILVWLGGDDKGPNPSSPAVHPAGTALSPLWYLTGFSHGMSPATLLWDLPGTQSEGAVKPALAIYHGSVRLRLAMADDYLGAAAELVRQVGIEEIQRTEQNFGIGFQLSGAQTFEDLTSQPVSLFTATQAYGVFANQGVMSGQNLNRQSRLQTTGILKVETVGGHAELDWADARLQPIVTSQLAYLVTNVLSDPKAHSSALAQTLNINRPSAVKVSIDSQVNSAWVVGYIPQRVVGVWVRIPPSELTGEIAVNLWGNVLKVAAAQIPSMDFAQPGGISKLQVCDPSGLLVTTTCPSPVDELFLQGSEPTQVDNLYQEYPIDKQTGLLATIFTPSELVEKKVFMSIPPDAREWATAFGLPLPPMSHDEVPSPAGSSSGNYLSLPKMSASVRGTVDVYGRATMENFSYYRLQVGQGVYPTEWIQIGQEIHQPAEDGLLGKWDTIGLDGPYIIQLLVVSLDQKFERVFLLVNVDNNPPQVQILAPGEGSVLLVTENQPIILQASAGDDQALFKVDFLIDNVMVDTRYQAPFTSIWLAKPGSHILRVIASDLAGNEAGVEQKFSISR